MERELSGLRAGEQRLGMFWMYCRELVHPILKV